MLQQYHNERQEDPGREAESNLGFSSANMVLFLCRAFYIQQRYIPVTKSSKNVIIMHAMHACDHTTPPGQQQQYCSSGQQYDILLFLSTFWHSVRQLLTVTTTTDTKINKLLVIICYRIYTLS